VACGVCAIIPDTDTFIEVTKEELEHVALESTRTIEIDEFVDRSEIDPRYLIRPYYLVPDGKVGHDAFAVIRETIREMNKVAIGRVVLTNREHIIALDPLDKGLMGTLLRYPFEVRSEKEYFDDIQDVKVTKDNRRYNAAHLFHAGRTSRMSDDDTRRLFAHRNKRVSAAV
jgi:DNA end-binding protein Ku